LTWSYDTKHVENLVILWKTISKAGLSWQTSFWYRFS